jgi:hypothetical protein
LEQAACWLPAPAISGPRRVELSQAKLQAGLERRFPLDNRLLELFDVNLTARS